MRAGTSDSVIALGGAHARSSVVELSVSSGRKRSTMILIWTRKFVLPHARVPGRCTTHRIIRKAVGLKSGAGTIDGRPFLDNRKRDVHSMLMTMTAAENILFLYVLSYN